MSDLKPGSRFASSVCSTQVIVVKGAGEVDLRCGGVPMVPAGTEAGDSVPTDGASDGTLLGKRYVDTDETVEVLCTRPGSGSLSIGDMLLDLKDAKPLPSSD
ncbi:MAG: hypothetical protein NZ582_02625 [Acidimicrobiales bacterium]|nr:hypothetical protein [Acidimicrobiales bacterium]